MSNRTTTVCDGAGCTAEYDNPVSSRLASPRQQRGWGTLHGIDEKTGTHLSYDLCPVCFQKAATVLGLKSAEELIRERDDQIRAEMADLSPAIEVAPLVPAKSCGTCSEPYVGDSCYFCPPPQTPVIPAEDA